MAKTNVVSYRETLAIEGFLTYLNKHYSKLINAKDTYLIAAVSAWFHAGSSHGLQSVIGNNPFNLRPGIASAFATGKRKVGNDVFLTFPTLAAGFQAAAFLLIHAGDGHGYQLALNALKHGGNQSAADFLAAMAMSAWDLAHYGANDWLSAYDAKKNTLLALYTSITGVQLGNPHPKPKKAPPILPRDYNYRPMTPPYLDPWAAGKSYALRHSRASARSVDGTTLRR